METVQFGQIQEQSYAMKESLRALRTNIQFCGDDIKTILFTSAQPNEGKSTVVFNLARSLTELGKSVLVIDTDMRKSVFIGRLRAKIEGKKEIKGLSHYLSGQVSADNVIYATNIPKLYMIFAGRSVPNPTEMLDKKYFEKLMDVAHNTFDYVLIDTAPIGVAIDAAVVGKHCDGAVIVVGQGEANTRAIVGVKKQLEVAGVSILGAVLNKVETKKSHYGNYYGNYYGGYYGHYYGNYGNEEKDK